jgi:hypothetical protein
MAVTHVFNDARSGSKDCRLIRARANASCVMC